MSSGDTMYTVRVNEQTYGPAPMRLLVRWAEEGRVLAGSLVTPEGGEGRPAAEFPELSAVVNAPPTRFTGLASPPTEGSAVEVMIPYRNSPALVGYYVSVASLIPGLGLVTSPIAIALGAMGLRKRKREPHVRGAAHAWVAIILGSVILVGHLALVTAIIVSAMR